MFKQFLRVMLSLLLAVLAAMTLPASAQTAKAQAPASNAKAVDDVGRSVSPAPDQEAKVQIKELAAELKIMQAAVLEGQRKSIDWWFSIIGLLVGALAVMFGALPLLLTRQQKADISKELEEVKNLVKSIQGHEKIAKESSVRTLDYFEGVARSSTEVAAVKAESTEVARDPSASDSDKLRARAILAGQKTPRSAEQAQTAYELWAALALLNEQDDRAHFNAGYWAQVLNELKAQPGAAYWLQAIYKHYAQAQNANPETHEAPYNWGIALDAEAKALLGKDLPLAQAKWREAAEKYAQVLNINPNEHDAAFNWGNALCAEAVALADENFPLAQAKWREAMEKYAQALQIKPGKHEAASNWGLCLLQEALVLRAKQAPDEDAVSQCLVQAAQLLEKQAAMGKEGKETVAFLLARIYSMQDRAETALAQLEIARKANSLLANWETNPALVNLRATPAYKTWFNQHFPTKD